ncbi:DNA topoisomerase 2-binding protein 1 [Aphelenchoides fujianensis]|nr:DNA topoisomerase 2-binding protein 1 [Aphelenchoides fujianensis]
MMPSASMMATGAAAAASSRRSIRFVFVNVPEMAFNRYERAAIVAQFRAFNILQTAGFRPAFRADSQLLSKHRSPVECIYVLPAFCGAVFDHLLTLKGRQVIISPLVVIQVNELGGVFPMSVQPLWSLALDGKVLTTIGFGPDDKGDIERLVVRMGGLFRPTITAEVNWIIAVDSVTSLSQLRVAQNQNIQLVNREWLVWIEAEAYEFLHERDQFFEAENVLKYEIRPCSPPYLSQHHVHVETQTRSGNAIIWDDRPIGSSGTSQYPSGSVRMEGYTQMEDPNVRYESDEDEDLLDDEERALVERWKRQTLAEQETERRATTSHFDPFAMGATGQRTGVVSEATTERTRARRSKPPPPPPPVEQREEGELEDSAPPNPLDAALNSTTGFRGFSASSRFPHGQSHDTAVSTLTNQSEAEADDGGQTKSIVVTNSTQRTQQAAVPVFAVPPEPRSAPSTRSRSTPSVHTARTAEPPPSLAAVLSPVGALVATAVPPSAAPSAPVRVAAPAAAPAAVLSPVAPPPVARQAAPPPIARPSAQPVARPVAPSIVRQAAPPTAQPTAAQTAAPPVGRQLIFRSPVGPPMPQEEPTGWRMATPNPVPPAAEPPADELPHNQSHDSLSDFVVPDEQWAVWAQEVEESRRRRGLSTTRNTNNVTSANTTAATPAANGLVRPPPPTAAQRQVPPPNVGLVQQSPGGSQRRRLGIGKRMLPAAVQQPNGGDEEAERKRRKSGVAGAFRSPSPIVGHAPEHRRPAPPAAQRPNPGEPVFLMGQLEVAMKNTLRRKLNNAPIRSSVVDEYEPAVTHVITRNLVRSEKLLCAIATGKFVLVNEFVHDSVATRSWMKEDAYEFGNPRFGEDVRDTPRFAEYTAAFAQDSDQRVTSFEVKSMITAAIRCYRVEYIGQYLLEDASKLKNEEVYNPVFLNNIHDANLGASLQTSP